MTTHGQGPSQPVVSSSSDVERDESINRAGVATLGNLNHRLKTDRVEMAEQQQPMASPLSGGYLLIILAEPHSEQHKEIILKRLAQGKVL